MTFNNLMAFFKDERHVISHYVKVRYGDNVSCSHCGSKKVYQQKAHPKVYCCKSCKNTFSVFKGTIFEHTRTDLRKWFYAMYLFINAKKGISAKEIQRQIDVTYKTAWKMLHQIRLAMGNKKQEKFFETIVEMDETYVGGKPRKRNKAHGRRKSGRGSSKMPVVGAVDRRRGQVYAEAIDYDDRGKRLTSKALSKIVDKIYRKYSKTRIITDAYRGYEFMAYNYAYNWETVDHSKSFADGDVHTNSIESFWAIVKRSVYGVYHYVSKKYIQRYIDEFCFRYNNRENGFDQLLKQSVLV